MLAGLTCGLSSVVCVYLHGLLLACFAVLVLVRGWLPRVRFWAYC